ncbi:MAG: asparagine synthase (glutamine-hydrolyzing) [Deltaproteobacteria bacterium]|nr:asparagine synthase (glutamine-hydrolyzing) [Deltaproteobacteria bacterium]
MINFDTLKNMTMSLKHRGPDDEGYYTDAGIALGHRRLSIIDLDTGKQPIHNEDKTINVVFNGEIYNFPDLKKELEGKGHRFYTRTDTEVLVHLYEEMGEGCLERLNGMFAFAIWDGKRKKLFLARDRIGIKPLYYAYNGKDIAFASEPKALLQLPWVDGRLDPLGLSHYLSYDFIPAPYSIYKDIRKVPPGHQAIYQDGNLQCNPYWDLDLSDRLEDELDEEEICDLIWGEFCRSVKTRLISDVPLGVLLSGGIDSTSVLAALRHEGVNDIKTFSIGFEDSSFDESKYFRRAATFFETDHHEEVLAPHKLVDTIPEVASILDEPLADASIMPTYLLSRFARGHVKVALGGDGGDELFAGYPTYQAFLLARYYAKLPQVLKSFVEVVVKRLPVSFENMSFDFRAKKFISGIAYPPLERNYIWLGTFSSDEKDELLVPDIMKRPNNINSFGVLHDYLKGKTFNSELGELLYLDTKLYLQDGVLVKVDRASMAHGLEIRVPFLDHHFVEMVTGLPEALKLKGFTSKYIWKRAVKDRIPEEIQKRGKKGFGIPVGKWLSRELKKLMLELLSERRLKKQGVFNPSAVKTFVDDHLARRVDNRKKLWNLLIFQLWWDSFGSRS